MVDIKKIPTSELEKDLLESYQDIAICKTALALEVTSYSHGSVKDRLKKNKYFVKVITAELERRRTMRALDPPSALVSVGDSINSAGK